MKEDYYKGRYGINRAYCLKCDMEIENCDCKYENEKIFVIDMLDNDKTIPINSVKKERIIPLPKR